MTVESVEGEGVEPSDRRHHALLAAVARGRAAPRELAVSALTMAELTAGPHATTDSAERAARQDRLHRAEATFDALPFDSAAARAYGRIYARSPRPDVRPAVREPWTY
jgi:predicted nucleic acid-binding protein